MVARIAPSPIVTSVASGSADVHAVDSTSALLSPSTTSREQPGQAQQTAANTVLPPSPPGEAFAAAVIAGQLSPRPTTPQELERRLGSAWQAPASSLRLLDRTA